MKLDRCKNGHMYDVSRYSLCPYCKSEGLETEVLEDKINLVEEMVRRYDLKDENLTDDINFYHHFK